MAADHRLRFGLLHVRDGRGQESDPPINEDRWFKTQGRPDDAADAVALVAKTRYRRKLGLQFKCFVDHEGVPFETVSELLAELRCLVRYDLRARFSRCFCLLHSVQ
jgi:hypothetical protein